MSQQDKPRASATFSDMAKSTQQDWDIIAGEFLNFAADLPDRIFKHLLLLEGDFGGFPVDRLTHSLQTATLAYRDGRDEEYVVCALLHDIGDTLGTYNHPDVAAAILKPFISEENHWMVQHHGIFQGYNFFHYIGQDRNLRDQYKQNKLFDYTVEFCQKYDCPAFDKNAETLPLEFFEPMLRRVMASPRKSLYKMEE